MRVLVCGGRNYNDVDRVYAELDKIKPTTVIHGAANGADSIAEMWADERGVALERFPAEWRLHGKLAGPMRNEKMLVEGKPELVVAFPGGRGTADTVRRAKDFGIPVVEVTNENLR